jgi:hypothetical protein
LTAISDSPYAPAKGLDEEHRERARRILAEEREQRDAAGEREREREQRRRERHDAAGRRPGLEPRHGRPPASVLPAGHMPLIHSPIFSGVAAAAGSAGETRPRAITTMRSQISSSSSRSSPTTSTAAPASRSASSSPRICAAAPTSTPQVGCATTSARGRASISRPTMNFCRLPPERLAASAPAPAAFTLKRRIRCPASSAARRVRIQPWRPSGSVRVSSVFAASESVGTAPRPRRSSGMKCRPRVRRRCAAAWPIGMAEEADGVGSGAGVLARERGEQLLLAVAGDAGDAQDLAFAHLERRRRQVDAEAIGRASVSPRTSMAGRRRGGRVAQLRRLGADHQARQARVGLRRRVDLARDAAAPQHGAVVAQRADLVELVADVEDAAALGRELAQGGEQRRDGLRREHRRGLVEDQQARPGEQGADDLDALALADGQRVHGAQRVDVQAVDARELGDPLVTSAAGTRLVQAEPDVLGDRERLEQAEVLEDHRDAQPARLLRAGDAHLRPPRGCGPRRAGRRRR